MEYIPNDKFNRSTKDFFKLWAKNYFTADVKRNDWTSFSSADEKPIAYFPDKVQVIEARTPFLPSINKSKADLNKNETDEEADKRKLEFARRQYTAFLTNIWFRNQDLTPLNLLMFALCDRKERYFDSSLFSSNIKAELIVIIGKIQKLKLKGKLKPIKTEKQFVNYKGLPNAERLAEQNKIVGAVRKNKTTESIQKYIDQYCGKQELTQQSIAYALCIGKSTVERRWKILDFSIYEKRREAKSAEDIIPCAKVEQSIPPSSIEKKPRMKGMDFPINNGFFAKLLRS